MNDAGLAPIDLWIGSGELAIAELVVPPPADSRKCELVGQAGVGVSRGSAVLDWVAQSAR